MRQQIDDALSLHAAGKLNASIEQLLPILETTPDNTEVLTGLASIYMQLNKLTASQHYFEKSLRLEDKNVLSLHHYGLLLEKLNRPDEAVKFIDAALTLHPQYEDAYKNKVILLKKLGQVDAVIETLFTAISHIKHSAYFYFQLHHYLHDAARYAEALAAINHFIALDSQYLEAYNNRGNTLLSLKKPKEALASYSQALRIDPNHVHALSNSSNAYLVLNKPEQALISCDAALAIDPNFVSALNNRANTLKQLKRFDEALVVNNAIVTLDKSNHFALFNNSLIYLLCGNFKAGWPLYELRWLALPNMQLIKELTSKPLWLGKQSLKHKTILLNAEQGYGDIIQFCRYVPLVVNEGAQQVYITVPKVLYQLLVDSFKHCAETRTVVVISDGDVLPPFDYQCPLMSLPMAFNTQISSIPASVPYLFADKKLIKNWQSKILTNTDKQSKTNINVGIVWAGSVLYTEDINRSITLNLLTDILALNLQFHCLQNRLTTQEEASVKQFNLQTHHQHLHNFAQTAALISEMDLIISVDTAVAHLAGALGKPVWILLPNLPDFRWLLDRDDSPWYPTARLFRQVEQGNWADVIKRVYQALKTEFKLK